MVFVFNNYVYGFFSYRHSLSDKYLLHKYILFIYKDYFYKKLYSFNMIYQTFSFTVTFETKTC